MSSVVINQYSSSDFSVGTQFFRSGLYSQYLQSFPCSNQPTFFPSCVVLNSSFVPIGVDPNGG